MPLLLSGPGTNRVTVIREDGAGEDYAFASDIMIKPGDDIRLSTANGGGWGKRRRSPFPVS